MKDFSRTCIAFLIIAFASIFCTPTFAYPTKLRKAIDSLDLVLKTADAAITAKRAAIDSLSMMTQGRQTDKFMDIAEIYTNLNNDSSIIYYTKAYRQAEADGDSTGIRKALIQMSPRLAKATMFNEAISILNHIDPSNLHNDNKIRYYGALFHVYNDIQRYSGLRQVREEAQSVAKSAIDSLIVLLPDSSSVQKFAIAQHYLYSGDSILAMGTLRELAEGNNLDNRLFPLVTYSLANVYEHKPDSWEEYAYFLALAAKAKLSNGDCDNEALLKLGSELFRKGDLSRAYEYLRHAGKRISGSKSRNLYVTLVPTMSDMIESTQVHESRMRTVNIILLVLGLAVILTLAYLLRREHIISVKQTNANLTLSNTLIAKSQYINRLLGLCSVYVEGLEEFNRLVVRKLKANQTKDLYELLESGKLLKDQTEKFFEVFDNAVLNIYPAFIDEINSLLLPEKSLALTEQGALTPELRIAAFMRMGVTDSNMLSRFLGLSLNTIYTYRNRMKNRAADRENFENTLINLGKTS